MYRLFTGSVATKYRYYSVCQSCGEKTGYSSDSNKPTTCSHCKTEGKMISEEKLMTQAEQGQKHPNHSKEH